METNRVIRPGKRLPSSVSTLDCYALALVASVLLVFSSSFAGYFYGDSLWLLDTRPQSLRDALGSFFRIVVWYRPLSQPAVSYVLYRAFGDFFPAYHAVMLAAHAAVCVLLYSATRRLMVWQPAEKRDTCHRGSEPPATRLIAFTSALLFAVHPIHFYTTYDHAYFAEPLLACSLIACVWAFVANRHWIALLALLVGLLAKEAAVVAPFMLAVMLALNPELRVAHKYYLRVLAAMFVIVAIYLAIYMRAVAFRGPAMISLGHPAYVYHFHTTVLENLARYAQWAVTLPSGWVTDNWSRHPAHTFSAYVLVAVILVGTLTRLLRGQRLLISIGIIWFLITSLPTAGLDKFLLHHAYVPLLGISLLCAESFRSIASGPRLTAARWCLAILALTFLVKSLQIVKEEERGSWVAHSSRFVLAGVSVFRQWDHSIDESSTIWAVDSRDEPGEVVRGAGALARFATARKVSKIRVVPTADQIPLPIGKTDVAVRITQEGVADLTPGLRGATTKVKCDVPKKWP